MHTKTVIHPRIHRTMKTALLALLLAACGPTGVSAEAAGGGGEVATDAWNRALEAHQRDGGLDYAGLAADRDDLDRFLASLDGARPAGWGRDEQLAFWSNAYNAVVAHHVLERYPGISSVKEVDGFFDRFTFAVAGRAMTLNEIETEARDLDARSHFAVVCASASCPDLRGEAYRGERIDAQLDEQTRRFLALPKGLRYDRKANVLRLSSIFKWYAGDFTGGSTVVAFFSRGGLVDWVLPYLPESLRAEVKRREPAVRYLDYDWTLNDR